MKLCQKITNGRKRKGITQEQLAELSNVTVRTIQRIESGESTPRAFTLKAIAAALDISFEELIPDSADDTVSTKPESTEIANYENSQHFLKVLCLSCFSYLVIPFLHFLVPTHILKKSGEKNPKIIAFAKKIIRVQLYWKVSFWLLLLATLAYNLIRASYFQKSNALNYLVPFFVMYFINVVIITANLVRIKNAGNYESPIT